MRALIRPLDAATVGDIALVCAADALVGASFGAIAVSGGLPLWLPIVLSIIVFAGSAQFATVGVLLAGGSPVAAAITGLALNGRLLAYGFTVYDVFGKSRIARLLGAHFIVDESVAFAMQQAHPAQKRAAFWMAGLMLFVMWNAAVMVGAFAGRSIASTSALGLDAAFPVVLLALVWPSLNQRGMGLYRTTALGSLLAIGATCLLAPGLAVLTSLLALVPVAWRKRNDGGDNGDNGKLPDSPASSPSPPSSSSSSSSS